MIDFIKKKPLFLVIFAAIVVFGVNLYIYNVATRVFHVDREFRIFGVRRYQASLEPSPRPTTDKPPPTRDSAVGDMVGFGGFDWYVLEIEDDKALLLSVYITEVRIYHGPNVLSRDGLDYTELRTTWAQCKLRNYLNGEFFESFAASDRALIVETHNENPNNQWYYREYTYHDDDGVGGMDTDDRIFLLSVEEVVRYLGDSGQLANRPEDAFRIDDEYNEARIAYRLEGWTGDWWLRSTGGRGYYAVEVSQSGTINMLGGMVYNMYGGVRPALWVMLE
jgi:hypothetical protein